MRAFVSAVVLAAVSTAGCGDDPAPAAPSPTPAPTLQFVRVEPTQVTVSDIGASQQLKVFAVFGNQTERDVTAESTWGVSDPRIVTIAPGGLARAVGYGRGFYSATYQGTASLGAGTFVVEVPPNLKVGFTGVVRDQRGRPVAGAAVAAQPRAEIVLVENPSPFIERAIEDEIQGSVDAPVVRTHRIVTRAGATLDVVFEGLSARSEDDRSTIELYNGTRQVFPSSSLPQVPGRFKIDAAESECRLVVTARFPMRYRVTYREVR